MAVGFWIALLGWLRKADPDSDPDTDTEQ